MAAMLATSPAERHAAPQKGDALPYPHLRNTRA